MNDQMFGEKKVDTQVDSGYKQGISYRSVANKSALRGRKIHNVIEL